jgi:hypothetical protein
MWEESGHSLVDLLRLRTEADNANPEPQGYGRRQAVTQHAGHPFDDALGGVRAWLEALCQDGTGNSPLTVPADEVNFADAFAEPLENAGRGVRPESYSSLGASTQTDENKEERSPRPNCPDALDVEEMTKCWLGVDITGTTFKGNDAEGINR